MQKEVDQAVVLIGDIVNYEQLMHIDSQAALGILQKYQFTLNKHVERNRGIIKRDYFGIGFMAVFAEIKHAVRFALDVQKDFQEDEHLQFPIILDRIENEDLKESSIRFEGLNEGIVGAEGAKKFYVSSTFQATMANDSEFDFKPVENDRVQGIPSFFRPFEITEKRLHGTINTGNLVHVENWKKWLFSIGIAVVAGFSFFLVKRQFNSAENATIESADILSRRSIAVLPFQNLSEETTSFFSDGVMEDILTNLAKFKEMKVISRTSSMLYQNTNKSIPLIAQELGVNYLLEGSIRQQGETVKITVQLIDAREDDHVWAQTYERNIEDIFEIQSEVSKKIASALNQNISPEISLNLDQKPTESPKAYSALLEGRQLISLRTKDALEESLIRLNEALSFDPRYADALAEKAIAYMLMSNFNFMDEKEAATLSEKNALAAIQLDSKNEVAYAVLASLYDEQRKWVQSETAYKIALQLNPNNAIVNYWYSLLLREHKRYDEAIEYGSLAAELDPLYPVIHSGHAFTCLLAGRTDLAKTVLDKGRVLFDDFFSYHWAWGYYYLMLDDFQNAQAHFEKADLLNPDLHSVKRSLIYCKGKLGYTEEVESYILTQQGNTEEDFLGLANANAGLGRVEACLGNLKSLWRIGKLSTSIKESVKFKLLDGHEGYEELIREMEEKEQSG